MAPDAASVEAARRAVEDAVIALLKSSPFYAHVLLQMERIIEPEFPWTAAMMIKNMRPVLLIGPDRFRSLSITERKAILQHEVLHFLHRHFVRAKGKEPDLWNVACDIAINPYIQGLPKDSLMPELFGLEAGLTAEEYYKILSEDTATYVVRALLKVGGHYGESDTDDWLEGKYHHEPGPWGEADQVDEAMAEAIVGSIVEETLKRYGGGQGKIPAECARAVAEVMAPRVNYKHIIRMFVARHLYTSRQASWSRRNKRFPGVQPGYMKARKLNLLVAVDTSGSIDNKQLYEFWAFIGGLQGASNEVEITVVECDAKIHGIYKYTKKPPKMHGGGGTDFRPVFEWAEKQRPGFDAVIYLTDGHGTAPETQTIPTLWVISKGEKPVKWGSEVRLR